MKPVRFTDYWQRSGRRYTPAASTDIRRDTFERIEREQQRAAVVADWPEPAVPEWRPVTQSWAQTVRVD
jgi:hypothetical protein